MTKEQREKFEKQIAQEKRITELEMTVGTLRLFSNEQATCIERLKKDRDYFSDALDKQIEATLKLDKENAELKKSCQIQVDSAFETIYEKDDQLTNAKDLLRKWIEPKYDREELLYLTEQFLNSEVEK